jgi:hypothetical protein
MGKCVNTDMQHEWGDRTWFKNFGRAIIQKNEKVGWTLALQGVVEFIYIPYASYNTTMLSML